jgi:hypothetical protein
MLFVEHPSMSQSRHNEAYESKLSRTSFLHDSGDTSYESKHLPPFIVESSFNGYDCLFLFLWVYVWLCGVCVRKREHTYTHDTCSMHNPLSFVLTHTHTPQDLPK